MPILDYIDELTRTAGPPATSQQSYVGAVGVAIIGGRVKDALAAKDWGSGEVKTPYFRNVVAGAGAGFTGLLVEIVAADDAALVTNPVVLSSQVIPVASLVANELIALPPLKAGSPRRRLGVKLTPQGAASTAGQGIVGFTPRDGRPQNSANVI